MLLVQVGLLFLILILLLPILLFLKATKFVVTKSVDAVKGRATNNSPISARQCSNCKAIVSSSYKYCPFCNTTLHKTCVRCGLVLNPAWKHCPGCGQEN